MKNRKQKVHRNDLCPCGSGLKYKKCCLGNHPPSEGTALTELYRKRYGIRLKDPIQIEGIRRAGKLAIQTLDLVEPEIRPGIATDELNRIVHDFTIKNGAVPAPLNYRGYPKSVCISVNDVICHGIPGKKVLKDGDIVNVDVTPILNGFYADANKTFFVGDPEPGSEKNCECGS